MRGATGTVQGSRPALPAGMATPHSVLQTIAAALPQAALWRSVVWNLGWMADKLQPSSAATDQLPSCTLTAYPGLPNHKQQEMAPAEHAWDPLLIRPNTHLPPLQARPLTAPQQLGCSSGR